MSTVYVFQLFSSTKYCIYGAKSLEIKDLSDTQGIISTPRCFSLRRNHFRADSVSGQSLYLETLSKYEKHIISYHIISYHKISFHIIAQHIKSYHIKNIIPRPCTQQTSFACVENTAIACTVCHRKRIRPIQILVVPGITKNYQNRAVCNQLCGLETDLGG